MYSIHTSKDIYTVKSAAQFEKVRANVNDFTPIYQICKWIEGQGWVKVETMH